MTQVLYTGHSTYYLKHVLSPFTKVLQFPAVLINITVNYIKSMSLLVNHHFLWSNFPLVTLNQLYLHKRSTK